MLLFFFWQEVNFVCVLWSIITIIFIHIRPFYCHIKLRRWWRLCFFDTVRLRGWYSICIPCFELLRRLLKGTHHIKIMYCQKTKCKEYTVHFILKVWKQRIELKYV